MASNVGAEVAAGCGVTLLNSWALSSMSLFFCEPLFTGVDWCGWPAGVDGVKDIVAGTSWAVELGGSSPVGSRVLPGLSRDGMGTLRGKGPHPTSPVVS